MKFILKMHNLEPIVLEFFLTETMKPTRLSRQRSYMTNDSKETSSVASTYLNNWHQIIRHIIIWSKWEVCDKKIGEKLKLKLKRHKLDEARAKRSTRNSETQNVPVVDIKFNIKPSNWSSLKTLSSDNREGGHLPLPLDRWRRAFMVITTDSNDCLLSC